RGSASSPCRTTARRSRASSAASGSAGDDGGGAAPPSCARRRSPRQRSMAAFRPTRSSQASGRSAGARCSSAATAMSCARSSAASLAPRRAWRAAIVLIRTHQARAVVGLIGLMLGTSVPIDARATVSFPGGGGLPGRGASAGRLVLHDLLPVDDAVAGGARLDGNAALEDVVELGRDVHVAALAGPVADADHGQPAAHADAAVALEHLRL